MRPILLLLLAACGDSTLKLDPSDPSSKLDADKDGYDAVEAGGDDCDDADPLVHPGATETWYDGVDQDCDGGSDWDQDGDGAAGTTDGEDCDDLDPAVHPAAVEVRDLADQDCDGLVDEDFIVAGSVVVTEVMHHPLAASDADAEWFDLTNTDVEAIDLVGWVVTADDGDAITIGRSVVLPAGGRLVLGPSADPDFNGGIAVDYVYDRAQLSLSAEDTLFVQVGGATVFDVEWTAAWGSVDGRALSLDPDHHAVADARQAGYWCVATDALASGDYGTPGALNGDCTALDEDGDGWSIDAGDCDDDDATVSPGAPDIWDGRDNDCSGAADDGDIGDAAVGETDGAAQGFLGVFSGLGVGDVTGDGRTDLVVGGVFQNNYLGAVYVISGEEADGLSGAASGDAVATVLGATGNNYFGATSPIAGDVTGDGVADLVVASGNGGAWGAGGSTAIAVYAGGSGLAGSFDKDDADFVVTSNTASGSQGANRVISHLDLNGDGLAELVYGQPNESSYKGRVSVFDAAALDDGLSLEDADLQVIGDYNDYVGTGLGGADIDGDGYDDLYVGATGESAYANYGGAWYQVDGGASWAASDEVDDVAARSLSGAETYAQVGNNAPAFADFDRDGTLDVAFGGQSSGAVWVWYDVNTLTSNRDTDDADLVIGGDDGFGMTVLAGDLDGDGDDDLVVGAAAQLTTPNWYATPGSGYGWLYAFDARTLGSGLRDSDDAWASVRGETSGDLFGSVAAGMLDIDGDRADDVLVAAPRAGTNAGRAYVLKGR